MGPIANHDVHLHFFRDFGRQYGYADVGIDIEDFRRKEVPQLEGTPFIFCVFSYDCCDDDSNLVSSPLSLFSYLQARFTWTTLGPLCTLRRS